MGLFGVQNQSYENERSSLALPSSNIFFLGNSFFSCLTDNVQTKFEMGEDAKERRKKIRKKRRKRQILSLFSSKIKFY
jgi:hypothetical protein